jgi:hypothetical protein
LVAWCFGCLSDHRFGLCRTPPTLGIGSNRPYVPGSLFMLVHFDFCSLFFYRCQRTFYGETLSPKPLGVGSGGPCVGLVEVRSRTLDRGSCFHPLCVIERLVFGVFEPSDERRLPRSSERASQSSFEVHRGETGGQTASVATVLCVDSGPGGAIAVPPPSGKKTSQPSHVPSGCGSP